MSLQCQFPNIFWREAFTHCGFSGAYHAAFLFLVFLLINLLSRTEMKRDVSEEPTVYRFDKLNKNRD